MAVAFALALASGLPPAWQARAFEPAAECSPARERLRDPQRGELQGQELQRGELPPRELQRRELPPRELRLREPLRAAVELRRADLRRELPEQSFHLILCRNVAFTYFDERGQSEVLERLLTRLLPGGLLVVGKGEQVATGAALEARGCGIYQYRG